MSYHQLNETEIVCDFENTDTGTEDDETAII